MKTYNDGYVMRMAPVGSEWVPAEVAQRLYDALDDALMWIDSPRVLEKAQEALAAADGEA